MHSSRETAALLHDRWSARSFSSVTRDQKIIADVRSGDEAAFCELVDRYSPDLLAYGRHYTRDHAIVEDAVQDAWIGVLDGICRFEGRSSLRTWIFRIFLNRLKTRLSKELRTIPLSSLARELAREEPAMPAERFLPADHSRWPGHWKVPPGSWGESPEEQLLAKEAFDMVGSAIASLPVSQREVVTLRDICGWDAASVCEMLEVSEANQRVLLHRARAGIRNKLEDYFHRGTRAT